MLSSIYSSDVAVMDYYILPYKIYMIYSNNISSYTPNFKRYALGVSIITNLYKNISTNIEEFDLYLTNDICYICNMDNKIFF